MIILKKSDRLPSPLKKHNFQDILLKIGLYTLCLCPDMVLKFRKAISNRFGDIDQNLLFLAYPCEYENYIFFNKYNNFSDILLKIGMYTLYVCPDMVLKFHKAISNSFADVTARCLRHRKVTY